MMAIVKFFRTCLDILIITIILILLLAYVVIPVYDFCILKLFPRSVNTSQFILPAYRESDKSWLDKYRKEEELNGDGSKWAPYIYWNWSAFHSHYVNINDKGIRKTTQGILNKQCTPQNTKNIYMFGGSTMIGQGSPDSKTIPSYVARLLNANGYCVHIVNYGIYGYDNIQEILRLFLILKKANHPNIVVFYDGVNDTFADFQNQRAGLFQNAALYAVTPRDSLQYYISLIFRYLERKFVVHILHGVFHISDRSLPHPNKLISAGITDYHN